MKKSSAWASCLSALAVTIPAYGDVNKALTQGHSGPKAASPLIEVKTGYLFFANQKMRDIYRDGNFQVQFSGSYPIQENVHIYGSVGFMEAWGKSTYFHQKTSFWKIPVDIGLKPVVRIGSCVEWYAALGPRYLAVQ